MAIAKASKLTVILLTVAALAVALTTIAAITINQSVSSSGAIITEPNVGVYSNIVSTTKISSINWGSVEAGGSASQTIYVKNTGGTAMMLSLVISNWSPSTASTYINLTWTGQGSRIAAGGSLPVTLTLTVSSSTPNSITSFSNSITISGTG